MRGQTWILWLTIGEGALLLLLFMWMPVMSGARAFFGVRVDERTFKGQGRAILRRYQWTLAALFVIVQACGYLLAARYGAPLIAVLASFASVGVGAITYHRFAGAVRPFAVQTTATRFASSLRVRRLADYTSVLHEIVAAVATIAPVILLAAVYPLLPDPVPVHWDARGRADGWAAKSMLTVFFLPALGFYMQLLFLVLKRDLVHAKMTLPAEHTIEYAQGKERLLLANLRIIDWARVFIGVLFFVICLMTAASGVEVLRLWMSYVTVALWASVALMIGGIFFYLWRAMRINTELEDRFGDAYVQRPSDEAHWRHGGMTYYNPDDPALTVEKLIGVGYTYNMAHPAIYTRLALLVGIPLFIVWAALSI